MKFAASGQDKSARIARGLGEATSYDSFQTLFNYSGAAQQQQQRQQQQAQQQQHLQQQQHPTAGSSN